MSGKRPIGDYLRKIFEDAMKDERRSNLQLLRLDECFQNCMNVAFADLEGLADFASQFLPKDRNEWIILENLREELLPVIPIPLEINTEFTDFTPEQVCALPNYIRLHELARRENVAIKLVGVVNGLDELDEEEMCLEEPMVIIDPLQTYEEGRDNLYPDLPPVCISLYRKPGSHDLES